MKPGRNDLCICGSGKKFKNCCMGKVESRSVDLRSLAPTPAEMNHLAALFNAGRYAELENRALLLIKQFPDSGQAWMGLGLALQMQGKDALLALQRTAQLLPDDAVAHNNLANTLRERGKLEDSMASCRRALKIKPDFAEAHNNLGLALMEQGQLDVAVTSFRRALEIKPDFAEAHSNLGLALNRIGRFDEAAASFLHAVKLKPDFAAAHVNLGNTLKKIGQLDEAAASFRRAVEIRPDFAEAHNNLGDILKDLGQADAAIASFRRAVEIKPDYAEAHNNLANIFIIIGQFESALGSGRKAVSLKPDFVEAHNNLGIALSELGQLDAARASYQRALEIKPDFAQAHCNLGNIYNALGETSAAVESFRRALELKPDFVDAQSNLLFTLNYTAHPLAYCLEQAREYGRKASQKAGTRYTTWQCAESPQRLRVGMVSGDLHNHPVGYFLESLLADLDPARVELIAYPTDLLVDALTTRIKPYFSAWKPLYGLSDEAAARLIHADGVHVLLDLSGHTGKNRLPVFAWKPAPVQASWLGYFATTGMAEMDYLLADEVGVPEAQRKNYTETIWYLPDTRLCFSAPESDVPVAPLPAVKNGHITFGCFQNLTKAGDEVLAAWSKVLGAVPDATLRWQCKQFGDPEVVKQQGLRLQQHGIDPARVTLHGSTSRKAYLGAHAEVDLILDTFPYPGGTTTCEALWMGVPTLTLAGETLLARQGAGMLTAAGLKEWIANNEAEYIAKAVALAHDPSRLATLRAGLREQVRTSPLFDAQRFARHFEDALWEMWQVCTRNKLSSTVRVA